MRRLPQKSFQRGLFAVVFFILDQVGGQLIDIINTVLSIIIFAFLQLFYVLCLLQNCLVEFIEMSSGGSVTSWLIRPAKASSLGAVLFSGSNSSAWEIT